jgi:hypothetical protein
VCTSPSGGTIGINLSMYLSVLYHLEPSILTDSQLTDPFVEHQVFVKEFSFRVFKFC